MSEAQSAENVRRRTMRKKDLWDEFLFQAQRADAEHHLADDLARALCGVFLAKHRDYPLHGEGRCSHCHAEEALAAYEGARFDGSIPAEGKSERERR